MKYAFATNINKTGTSGIVDVKTQTILCICTEETSKIILEALKSSNKQSSERGVLAQALPCIDFTFATRLKSFVSDIQCHDQPGYEEKNYIEKVANDLLEYQQKNASEQWETDYLERCHGNHKL